MSWWLHGGLALPRVLRGVLQPLRTVRHGELSSNYGKEDAGSGEATWTVNSWTMQLES